MKIRLKLALGFMLIVSLVAIVGSVCLYQLNQIAKPLKYDIPETVKIINESSHLDGLAQFIRYYDEVLTQSARNFAFTQNKKWEQRYRDVEPKLNIIIKEAIERGDEKDKEYFSSVNKANLALVEMEYKAIELVNNAQAENAVKILESNEYWSQKNIYEQGLRDYVQRKGAQYDEALEISTQEVESANNKTKNMIGMSTLLVLIFVVVAVILSIGIGLFIFWSISNPLARLKTAAAQIGAGKLDTQIEINSSDEIGELAISFNKMAEDLHDIFSELESIYENAPVGLSYVDTELRYLRINRYLADLNGRPVSEHIGRTVSEMLPEIKDIVMPINKKVIESGVPVLDLELSGTTKADPENTHYWLTSFFPQKSDSGSVQGLISVVKDITKEKHAEEQFVEYQTQLKNLASQLTVAEERERHRVAVGLHDQIGQPLAIAKMKSQMLLESGLSPNNQKEAKDICDLLSTALEDSRSLTFELSSPLLYELGLEAALQSWLKKNIGAKHAIKTEFSDDKCEKPLDERVRNLLFRNVKELLTNVVRHAQAQNIKVDIRRANDTIEICVEDDGVGFTPDEKTRTFTSQKGYGLFSIREQLENIDGHIEIDSAVGRGCRVKLTAPLKTQKAS
jgi:signal transduction histidine kinase